MTCARERDRRIGSYCHRDDDLRRLIHIQITPSSSSAQSKRTILCSPSLSISSSLSSPPPHGHRCPRLPPLPEILPLPLYGETESPGAGPVCTRPNPGRAQEAGGIQGRGVCAQRHGTRPRNWLHRRLRCCRNWGASLCGEAYKHCGSAHFQEDLRAGALSWDSSVHSR